MSAKARLSHTQIGHNHSQIGYSSGFVLQIPELGIIIPKMGRATKKLQAGLASALFSKTQLRVLSLLIGHPDERFHTSEIIRLARSGSGSVQRELEKLTKVGILTSESTNNRKIYQANKSAPIFKELHRIILKTTGLLEPIRRSLSEFQNKIHFAFVYGSVAKGLDTAKSDVDIMVVGDDLTYSEVFTALQRAEKAIHRSINPNLVTPSEWKLKLSNDNAFVKKILEQPKLIILGSEHELEQSG